MKLGNIFLETEISLDDVASAVARDASRDVAMRFILDIDGYIADYDFSCALRDRLSESIALEEVE